MVTPTGAEAAEVAVAAVFEPVVEVIPFAGDGREGARAYAVVDRGQVLRKRLLASGVPLYSMRLNPPLRLMNQ